MVAYGGTVVLDEVGDLPRNIQDKLLTLLKDKKIRPLGVDTDATCDVRVIATNSGELKPLVDRGAFALELHTRLKAISIDIPALKDRREDVIPLTRHFLKAMSSGDTEYTIAPDARGALLHYNWPGNTKELHDLVQSLLGSLSGNLITGKDLPQNLLDALGGRKVPTLQVDTASGRGVAAAEFIRSQSGALNGSAAKEKA